jgi:hypothetical protein
MTKPMIKKVCEKCGSENVYIDAYAGWSVERQSWELASTFDNSYCSDCDTETYIDTETDIINQEIKEMA